MRIFSEEKDRLQFIVDFVNRKDIAETEAFTDADLEILRAEFTEFIFMNLPGYGIHPDFLGFAPKPTRHPFPSEFEKKDVIELHRKLTGLLDEMSDFNREMLHLSDILAPEMLPIRKLGDPKHEGIPISVNIRRGIVIQGSTIDVLLFCILMLIRFPHDKILRCPNWKSRICKQKFFLREGKNVYCSSRCGNAYRVWKSHKVAELRKRVQRLSKEKGMRKREISRRLDLPEFTVEALLKTKSSQRKLTSRTTRRK